MPVYVTRCNTCGTEKDIFLPLSRYEELPECCGTRVQRVIQPTMVSADIQPYRSMATGEIIGSRSAHRRHLKDHKLVEVGDQALYQRKPSWTEQAREKRALREEIGARLSQAS